MEQEEDFLAIGDWRGKRGERSLCRILNARGDS